jgi:simple sugar transport system permease protein
MSIARRIALALAAPLLAVVFSLVVTAAVLLATGAPPLDTFKAMIEYGVQPRTMALIVNSATYYYLAAVAVAIGFRMNLFNIGVDGQYRMAALVAAAVGGAVNLPAVLHVGLILVVAVLVGAFWAALAGLLKVVRGVSEVISTIMLNAIATYLIAYLLTPDRLAVQVTGSNNIGTRPIPESGRVPGLDLVPGSSLQVFGLIVLAALVGVGYWFLLGRTRFGFDLRATGMSESAAVASGVNVKKMVVASMVISGGVAGLVGMPQLLGASYTYALDFPAGIGFTGIAIALLGRNHPIGIAIAALLWAFLDQSAQILDLRDVPTDIVQITQAVIVLSVVIAYEVVRRYRVAALQREVSRQLGATPPPAGPGGSVSPAGAGASA